MSRPFEVINKGDHYCGRFSAMASPCELLIDSTDSQLAESLTELAQQEAKRIENKYSRYQKDNVMDRINHSNGKPVDIDVETERLLTFADTCYQLSNGLFDITSGVLRKAWRFDGSDKVPSDAQVQSLLPFVGWQHVTFSDSQVTLPPGFELDLGGIGKEYAVDSVAKLCHQHSPKLSILVNFGGDIQVTRPRERHPYWQVGIEDPSHSERGQAIVNIASGGLATSGDARRFLLKEGHRYGHILNPITGYPVDRAPRSVTVAASQCIESGLLATLALLQGPQAEQFLAENAKTYWCFW